MQLTECINFLLTSAQNTVFLYFKMELQQFQVTPIQYALLKCLWDEDEQIPTQLAQQLRLDSSTVTGILSRLEDKHLLERRYSKVDRRKVTVCLTEEGRKLQEPIEACIEKINQDITIDLSPEELAVLKSQLEVVTNRGAMLLGKT